MILYTVVVNSYFIGISHKYVKDISW